MVVLSGFMVVALTCLLGTLTVLMNPSSESCAPFGIPSSIMGQSMNTIGMELEQLTQLADSSVLMNTSVQQFAKGALGKSTLAARYGTDTLKMQPPAFIVFIDSLLVFLNKRYTGNTWAPRSYVAYNEERIKLNVQLNKTIGLEEDIVKLNALISELESERRQFINNALTRPVMSFPPTETPIATPASFAAAAAAAANLSATALKLCNAGHTRAQQQLTHFENISEKLAKDLENLQMNPECDRCEASASCTPWEDILPTWSDICALMWDFFASLWLWLLLLSMAFGCLGRFFWVWLIPAQQAPATVSTRQRVKPPPRIIASKTSPNKARVKSSSNKPLPPGAYKRTWCPLKPSLHIAFVAHLKDLAITCHIPPSRFESIVEAIVVETVTSAMPPSWSNENYTKLLRAFHDYDDHVHLLKYFRELQISGVRESESKYGTDVRFEVCCNLRNQVDGY